MHHHIYFWIDYYLFICFVEIMVKYWKGLTLLTEDDQALL